MPEVPAANARLYHQVGDIVRVEETGEALSITEVRENSIIIERQSASAFGSPPLEVTVWYEPPTEDDSTPPISPAVWDGFLTRSAQNVAAAINSPEIPLPANRWTP